MPIAVVGDPMHGGYLEIQGAHIVSEGAYFRFWLWTRESYNISVTINDKITFYLEPNASMNYDVVAPHVSMPFEQIHYLFKVNVTGVNSMQGLENHFPYTLDFPVYVFGSGFIQFFDYFVPVIVILIATTLAIITLRVIRRRQKASSPKLRMQPLAVCSSIKYILHRTE
jgi:hypothetical protein